MVETDGDAGFATTRALAPGEGFTIAVAWPKGFVTPPGTDEKIQYMIEDYQGALIGFGGLILLLAYYCRPEKRRWRATCCRPQVSPSL